MENIQYRSEVRSELSGGSKEIFHIPIENIPRKIVIIPMTITILHDNYNIK